jgi:hypothetical protein
MPTILFLKKLIVFVWAFDEKTPAYDRQIHELHVIVFIKL